jgi:hypothetical protein
MDLPQNSEKREQRIGSREKGAEKWQIGSSPY